MDLNSWDNALKRDDFLDELCLLKFVYRYDMSVLGDCYELSSHASRDQMSCHKILNTGHMHEESEFCDDGLPTGLRTEMTSQDRHHKIAVAEVLEVFL
jgi:hypothetical protein